LNTWLLLVAVAVELARTDLTHGQVVAGALVAIVRL
jgi:hypothetical protein